MKKSFIALLWLASWLQLSMNSAVAQPSVYSGAFVLDSGGLSSSQQSTITNFVNQAQKDISIINIFKSWATSGTSPNSPFSTSAMNYIRNHGSIPLVTWEPWNPASGVTQSTFSLASITNGTCDSFIVTWATAAKSWGHPFFLRLAHEMNGNWYPWGSGVNGNTSGQYLQMWRHVHDIFTSVGATNVTWVWCVNFVDGLPAIGQFYPGDNYVDWISLDGYCRKPSTSDYSSLAANTMIQLANIAPGKPIMVAETGCNQLVPDKSQWFRNALTNYLPMVQPRIKAWVYFNSTNSDGNDWRITSPASATSGYQQGIGLSYYDTNQYGAISSNPIQPLTNDVTVTDTMAPFVSIVSPAMDLVNTGTVVNFLALASDKSGVSKVVFSLNGVAQQTNNAPPYQFTWIVPVGGGIMYTCVAKAFDNAGNGAVSTIEVISQGIATTTMLQTVSQASGDWSAAIWGNPAAFATNGNSYETADTFHVRTPNNLNPAAFAGNSLQIDGGGILDLKNVGETSGSAATVNLFLNGGQINFHGGFAANGAAVAGIMQVLADSLITTDQTGVSAGDIWLQSVLSGSGNLTVNMNSTTTSVLLSGNNSAYTGNWTNASTFGNIEIVSGTANAFGSGSVTLVNAGSWLVFNSTNNLALDNIISGLGSVVKQNANTVTLNGNNIFTGLVQITNGVLQLGASGSIGSAAAIELSNGAVFDVTAVSGFAVGSFQTLAGVGSISGDVTINGTVSPGPLETLNFANNLALSGTAVMELDRTNAQNADLISAATLAFGGTLTVTNIGGALQAGDSFQLFSGAITGAFAVTNLPALSANLFWDTSKLNGQGILTVALQTAAAPIIFSPTLNGTNLTLQINSQPGFNYMLQATAQLSPADWTSIQTNIGGGSLSFTIPISSAQQFFRICVQ